jgi:hypothetical protein
MRHRSTWILGTSLILAGCSGAPASESVGANTNLLAADDTDTQCNVNQVDSACVNDGDGSFVMTLTDFSVTGDIGTLSGTVGTTTLAIPVVSGTRPQRAPINIFPPGPIRDDAVAWNGLIAASGAGPATLGPPSALEGSTFAAFTLDFANAKTHMRVLLDQTGTAKFLRPLP